MLKSKLTQVILLLILSASPVSAQTNFPQPVTGTVNSGGVACFDSTTQEISSATLSTNYVMLGGEAGICPKPISGLFSDLPGNLTIGSLITDLIESNGANDLVIEDNGIERLRLPSGHSTIQHDAEAALSSHGAGRSGPV